MFDKHIDDPNINDNDDAAAAAADNDDDEQQQVEEDFWDLSVNENTVRAQLGPSLAEVILYIIKAS